MKKKKIAPHRLLTLFTLLAASILPATAQTPATQTPAQQPAQTQPRTRRRRAAKPPAPVALKPLVGSIASHPGWPQPKPSDVGSPEAILTAVYEVISGPKGQPRDWDRMRSLFLPDGRLIPSKVLPGSPNSASPNTDATMLTIDDYIARSSPLMAADGFFEQSIHNEFQQYGNIVQIWSTYEGRHAPTDATPFARGINSFQLLKDGDRYWVVNVFWGAETPSTPIPAAYLSGSGSSNGTTTHATSAMPAGPTDSLNTNFNGNWVGQLEYRDSRTDAHTFLPTWLTLTPIADGNTIQIAYIYDDGPTKIVRENSTLTLFPATNKAILTSDFDLNAADTAPSFDVQGLTDFAKQGQGTLILTGKGKENGHSVDIRLTLTLGRNLYNLRKETKAENEDFKFRDSYTFTRAEAPRS